MRSTRVTARPQLRAMSVALEAQGETVPRRGVTTRWSAFAQRGRGRLAVGQQLAQALQRGLGGRGIEARHVHEARAHRVDAGLERLQAAQQAWARNSLRALPPSKK
jgi:hypothetical protein